MKQLFAFLLISTALVACASTVRSPFGPSGYTDNPPSHGVIMQIVPVYIDKNFSAEHRAAVHAALAAWNFALNGYERFDVISDVFDSDPEVLDQIDCTGQGLIVLQRSLQDLFVLINLPEGVLAWVPAPPQGEAHELNIVSDVVGNRDLQAIVQHEIGHVLGLDHVLVQNTLMFPLYYLSSTCIDRVTVQALSSLRPRFDWKRMNYCERPL